MCYCTPSPTQSSAESHSWGDIGRHFPDTDHYMEIPGALLAARAAKRVAEAGYVVGNIDATIVAEALKMAPHIPLMQANIAADLGIRSARLTSR